MDRTQAVYYRDPRGAEPVDEFIQALPPKRAAKIDDFVEEYLDGQPPEAPPPAFPITSQIEGELCELRVRFANTSLPTSPSCAVAVTDPRRCLRLACIAYGPMDSQVVCGAEQEERTC